MLPNSYAFRRGDTREQAIQRMQQAQQQVVKEAWERRSRDLPLRTPEQLVILASIIEKETSKPEERTRVAAVFANRLKQKMRLQTDPTMIYGLAPRQRHARPSVDRERIWSSRRRTTPTSSTALPPGPIANPGPRVDRGRGQSGAHQGAVFRRRRHRRSCVRRDLRSAPARTSRGCARSSRAARRSRRADVQRTTPAARQGRADAAARRSPAQKKPAAAAIAASARYVAGLVTRNARR